LESKSIAGSKEAWPLYRLLGVKPLSRGIPHPIYLLGGLFRAFSISNSHLVDKAGLAGSCNIC
jgi:hypothetical protein